MTTDPVRGFDGDLGRFEVFLFTAIGTVLVTRGYLAATGYPQVGSGELHIAHVLWGGLLLGVAVVLMLVGLGSRVRWWAALAGGIGFGLFIDEVGKFLTKDVNYFYTPAVAVMYLLFALSYLGVRTALTRRELSDTRRLALAGLAVTDQSLGRLTAERRSAAVELLDGLSAPSRSSDAIRIALLDGPVAGGRFEASLTRLRHRAGRVVDAIVSARWVQITMWIILVLWTILLMTVYGAYVVLVIQGDEIPDFYDWFQLSTSLVSGISISIGLICIPARKWRRFGLQAMQAGILVDLIFNQFSTFRDSQFGALETFIPELLVLLAVRHLLRRQPDVPSNPAQPRADQQALRS